MYVCMYFLFFILHQVYAADHCKVKCPKGQHTACSSYKCDEFGSACGSNPKRLDMTKEIKQVILDDSNYYRSQVAIGNATLGKTFRVKASNMHVLKYNKELEEIITCWINQCIYKHDECRSTEKWLYVGQNLFRLWSSDVNQNLHTPEIVSKAIKLW